MRRLLLLLLLLPASAAQAAFQPKWNEPFPPHRIIGNVYYVGTNFLASYLITTNAGHILINPDYEESVPLIQQSVEKLGFKLRDIKIILVSHAHDDHVAGAARLKQLTGAQLMVMQADVKELEDGGKSDFHYPDQRWTPVKVDRELHDGDEVRLGNAVLKAHLTPGHTRGCTTWTTLAREHGRDYNVVIVGSPNVNPGYKLASNTAYPQIASDFARAFQVLKSLPCDIFLGAHGGYYGLQEKFQKFGESATNPFIDPNGYREYVTEREQAFRRELQRQQGSF
jgi:metallo-beta-lactamase class B